MTNAEYRLWLIAEILREQASARWTEEHLQKFPTRRLERIYDNLEVK